jgi:hypothetical protein
MNIQDSIKALRLKEHKHKLKVQSLKSDPDKHKKHRHNAMHLAYKLFADCLEVPWLTKISKVKVFIKDIAQYLNKEDIDHFNQLYELCLDYEEVQIGEIGKPLETWQKVESDIRKEKKLKSLSTGQ